MPTVRIFVKFKRKLKFLLDAFFLLKEFSVKFEGKSYLQKGTFSVLNFIKHYNCTIIRRKISIKPFSNGSQVYYAFPSSTKEEKQDTFFVSNHISRMKAGKLFGE